MLTIPNVTGGSRIERIDGVLRQAIVEDRVSEIDAIRYRMVYSGLDVPGDRALLTCLQIKQCDLDRFASLAASVGDNQLHWYFSARNTSKSAPNILKMSGNTAEHLMDHYYKRSGWTKIPGEIGNTGIDGLYIKTRKSDGVIQDVLITESKYNTSKLMERSSGRQMSEAWILNHLKRLKSANPENVAVYRSVISHVEARNYRARLWNVNMANETLSIDVHHVSSKGRSATHSPVDVLDEKSIEFKRGHRIDLRRPKNEFEKNLVDSFSRSIDDSSET